MERHEPQSSTVVDKGFERVNPVHSVLSPQPAGDATVRAIAQSVAEISQSVAQQSHTTAMALEVFGRRLSSLEAGTVAAQSHLRDKRDNNAYEAYSPNPQLHRSDPRHAPSQSNRSSVQPQAYAADRPGALFATPTRADLVQRNKGADVVDPFDKINHEYATMAALATMIAHVQGDGSNYSAGGVQFLTQESVAVTARMTADFVQRALERGDVVAMDPSRLMDPFLVAALKYLHHMYCSSQFPTVQACNDEWHRRLTIMHCDERGQITKLDAKDYIAPPNLRSGPFAAAYESRRDHLKAQTGASVPVPEDATAQPPTAANPTRRH